MKSVLDLRSENHIRCKFSEHGRGTNELQRYECIYGHTNVTYRYITPTGFELYKWLNNASIAYASDQFYEELMHPVFETVEAFQKKEFHSWIIFTHNLKLYRDLFGTAINQKYANMMEFPVWTEICRARKRYQNGDLSSRRTQEVLSLGFSLDPYFEKWMSHYIAARSHLVNGKMVPQKGMGEETGFHLDMWIREQVRQYRRGVLPVKRYELLMPYIDFPKDGSVKDKFKFKGRRIRSVQELQSPLL